MVFVGHSNSDEPNLNPSPLAGGDGSGTPLPPRGLRFRGMSSLDLFYAERVRMEADPALEGSRTLVPSFQLPQPAPERSPGMKISINERSDARAPSCVSSQTDTCALGNLFCERQCRGSASHA